MRFAFDLRPALARPTGVGSYVMGLASRLPALAPEDRFTFWSASLKDRFPRLDWPQNVRLVDRAIPVRALNYAWNRFGWPPLSLLVGTALDLVHAPHPLIVPGGPGCKHVVTLHDLFFFKHPEMTSAEVRTDYAPLVREHVRKADGIICVSRHTAEEAHLLLDVPREKLTVIYNGIDPIYREAIPDDEVQATLSRRRLPRGALLYIGSSERRKNLVNLVMAYLGLARRRPGTPPLVLVGPGAEWSHGGTTWGSGVLATGHLPLRDVRALMAASSALVHVPLEEGFGLTVVEAMSAGLPVICSGGSALAEVAGDAARFVNPLAPASIASAIAEVLDDPGVAASLRARGLAQSVAFDWDTAARQTLDFYRRIVSA
jgi:glycosyltransferase involved in cell wall biosynthesis